MRGLPVTVLGLVLAVGLGCKPETKPLAGSWFMADSVTPVTMNFHEDGKYEAIYKGNGKEITQHGEYSQSGTWVNMYAKKVDTNDPEMTKAFAAARLEPQKMRARWISDDEVELISGENKRSMKRVKK